MRHTFLINYVQAVQAKLFFEKVYGEITGGSGIPYNINMICEKTSLLTLFPWVGWTEHFVSSASLPEQENVFVFCELFNF